MGSLNISTLQNLQRALELLQEFHNATGLIVGGSVALTTPDGQDLGITLVWTGEHYEVQMA